MHGNTTEDATVATVDEDGIKESRGAKDIFEYEIFERRRIKSAWCTKERDQVLQ
jgi:hypothetical protein